MDVDSNEIMARARAFARDHLQMLAGESLAWRRSGTLADGRLTEVGAMVEPLDPVSPNRFAEGLVVDAALEFAHAASPVAATAADESRRRGNADPTLSARDHAQVPETL